VGSVSVRTKILGMALTLTIFLGVVLTWQVRSVMINTFMEELRNRGLSVVSDLSVRSVDPILLNDAFSLHRLLIETISNHPDAAYAFVQDDQGQVIAHTFGDAGFPMTLLSLDFALRAQSETGSPLTHLVYQSDTGVIHEFTAPIFSGRAGQVRLGLSETRLLSIVNIVTGQLLLTTLVVASVGILAAMFLTWLLTRPILDLVSTTRAVAQGNLYVRAPHWSDDEIGSLADAFNQMVEQLKRSQSDLAEKEQARAQLLHKLINAQEDERRRIARDLHDGVGQMLTSIIVGMRTAQRDGTLAAFQARSEDLCKMASETLTQVRILSRELRPSLLDDLGLAAALERYVAEFPHLHPGILVDLHCDLPGRLPTTVETALYRIVQEAMTNAARHGKATSIGVLVNRRNNTVQTIVEDNGVGFDVEQVRRLRNSVGIFGMSERADLLGGRLDIESGLDGTTIYVEIPL
jgi:signal transduction histidine kinase